MKVCVDLSRVRLVHFNDFVADNTGTNNLYTICWCHVDLTQIFHHYGISPNKHRWHARCLMVLWDAERQHDLTGHLRVYAYICGIKLLRPTCTFSIAIVETVQIPKSIRNSIMWMFDKLFACLYIICLHIFHNLFTPHIHCHLWK